MECLCMNTNTYGVQWAANTFRVTDHCTAATGQSQEQVMEDQH